MYYCENCKHLCHEKVCEECQKTDLRPPLNEDFCYFTECPEDQAKMLKESLKSEGIPCALIPNGSGVRSALGLTLENMKVFLPFGSLNKAQELFDGIFLPPLDETEELRTLLLENEEKWHITGFFNSRSLRRKLGLPKGYDIAPTLRPLVQSAANIRDEGLISSSVVGGHYLIVKTEEYDLTFDSISFELLYVKKK